MAKLVTSPIASIAGDTTSATAINANFAAVVTAMEKTLSRDGTAPNQMTADLDLNTNDILNVGTISAETVILLNEGEIINEDTARAEAAADAAEAARDVALAAAEDAEEWAGVAGQEADNAAASAAAALASENAAEVSEDNAADSAIAAAQSAEDADIAAQAALAAGTIYVDTTAGLAATASGDYFFVKGTNGGLVVADLYLDNAGVAVDQDLAIPSYAAYEAVVPTEELTILTTNDLKEPILRGYDGRAIPIGNGGVRVDSENYITTREYALKVVHLDPGEPPIILGVGEDGRAVRITDSPVDPALADSSGDSFGFLFEPAQYDEMEANALTEVLRLEDFDVSALAKTDNVVNNLRLTVGQSFGTGASCVRLFFSDDWIVYKGYEDRPAYSVGQDSRCVGQGVVFDTFGGTTTFFPLAEHYTAQTGTDAIISDADVASGNYAANAHGGTPETTRDIVFWLMHNKWNLNADFDIPVWRTIAMNPARDGASIAEISSGNDILRTKDAISVFDTACTAQGNGTRQVDLIALNHGEADEAISTATYEADVQAYYDDLMSEITSVLGQTDLPAMVMHQPGGPRATSNMVVSNQMVDMMLDGTGDNATKFLVSAKYEVPTFETAVAPHPDAGNDHPTLAGNVLMGIREGIAAHFIMNRNENYWLPFPFECKFEGNRFLLSIPNKFPPLREVDMVYGTTVQHPASLGITFETAGGQEISVLRARVVPGYKYLVEGYLEADIIQDLVEYTTVKTAKGDLGASESGFTNIRDSFDPELFDVPFNKNQIVANGSFVEDAKDTPFGRYTTDIPGWNRKLDLGNPVARRTITATPF